MTCRAFEELYSQGFKEGYEDEKRAIARRMAELGGISLEDIAHYTSLPLAEVRQLALESSRPARQ